MDRFKLKLLMAILILIESISMFIPGTPKFLAYPGRLIIPIAIMLLVEGYLKTSDRDNYYKRLIFWSEIMFVGNIIMDLIGFNGINGGEISYNQFSNKIYVYVLLIIIGSVILTFFMLRGKVNDKKGMLLAAYLLISNLGIGSLFNYEIYIIQNNIFLMLLTSFIFLNAITSMEKNRNSKNFTKELVAVSLGILTEGVIIVPALTYLFYKARNQKGMIYKGIIILSALFLGGFSLEALLKYPQWMMVFSIIIVYFYNGKEGKKCGKEFYIGYPIIIWLMYLIGTFI